MIEGSKITAPINIADPYTVMGVGKLNGTWYDVAYICRNSHGKINKWAKYKPTIQPYPDYKSDWWKDMYNKCGLIINTRGTYNLVITDYKNGDNWKYNPPTSNDWARITDFENYKHDATPIFTTCTITEIAVNKFPDSKITFTIRFGVIDSTGLSLKLSDISGIPDVLYLGIMLCKKGTTEVIRRCTGTENIVAQYESGTYLSTSIDCPVYGLSIGDYDAYPFLSSVQLTYNGGDINGNFFSLPYDNIPLNVTLIETDVEIYIHGTIRKMVEIGGGTTYSLNSYCDVTYSGAGSKTFNNNSYMIRFPDKNWNDTLITDEKKITIDNFTLQKGETKRVYENRLYSLPSSMDGNIKLWVTLSNAQYVESTVPLRPAD